jgi:SAM-dependent methyltransferase
LLDCKLWKGFISGWISYENMNIQTFYEDLETRAIEEAKEFSENPIVRWAWIIRLTRTVDLMRRLVKQGSKKTTIVDIGCAGAWLHNRLSHQGIDHKYVGCDISFTYLLKINETEKSCRILCDAKSLPFKNSSADIVTAFEVVEHLPEPGITSKEMKRVTKHSIAVSVPIQGWHLPFIAGRFNREAEQTEQKIRKLIETVGLYKGLRYLEKKTGSAHISVFTVSRLQDLFAGNEYAQEQIRGVFFYLPQMEKILENYASRRLYIFLDRILFSRLPLFRIYTRWLPVKPIGSQWGILVLHRRSSKT